MAEPGSLHPHPTAVHPPARHVLPFYIDDPAVDRGAHRLQMHTDEVESARRGYRAVYGTCSCGEWTTPTWDDNAVLGAYDDHMTDVQVSVHTADAPQARSWSGRAPATGTSPVSP